MSMTSVLIISVAAGIILVVGGGLMMYMANLVRNAYELKVQLKAEMDERLTKMAEELDKKSRWIKRDIIEETEKIKAGLETGNARRFQETIEPLLKRLEEVEAQGRRDRSEWVAAVERDREGLAKLDGKIGALRTELKALEPKAPPPPPAAAPTEAGSAEAAEPTPAEVPSAPSAPAVPAPARAMREFLPDLGAKRR